MINVDEVAVGVLVDAIAATGRRFALSARALRDRRQSSDIALARWFETYRLTEREPILADVPGEASDYLAEILRGDDVQAELQELLAVRLTDAPEADATRVRSAFELTLSLVPTGPGQGRGPGIPGQTSRGTPRPPSQARIQAAADLASLAAPLFDFYDDQVCDLVARLEAAEPALLSQIRSEALNARMIAILGAIERHTAAVSARPGWVSDAGFLARYRRHVVDQHGKIEPPDFQRRRRVPIADIYVPTAIFQVMEAERTRELDLATLAREIDRTVLLGDPGGGKTTAANVLLHDFAADPAQPVPFLVVLRDYAAKDPPERSVVASIEHTLETFYQCGAPPGLVDRLLLTGRALVIFDGLDELLDSSRRADVATRVERFCTEYPLARVLVTSRVVGYDQARLDDSQFTRYRLGGFSDGQVTRYAHLWFAQEDDLSAEEVPRWAAAFLEETASVPDLRTNPLLLSLMCILYRGEGSLPRNRAEIYEQCASLLFRKWDAHRRIRQELRAGHLLEPALRHLAWWLFSRGDAQSAVSQHELAAKTTEFLHVRGFESLDDARAAAGEFVDFSRGRMWVFSDAGTTRAGEPLYAFTHRTFLEYFAAAHLAFDSDSPEDLARTLRPHVARNEWEVVAELALQIKDRTSNGGAQRIYTALLGDRWRRPLRGRSGVLQFLARSLRSVDPPPRTVRDVTREVLSYLLGGDLNDKDRYLPLCWLLASCTGSADIVSSEIRARTDGLIGSDSDPARLNGLRMAAWLGYGIRILEIEASRGSAENPLEDFWDEWCQQAVRRHRETFTTEAEYHADIRVVALKEQLIDLSQALRMTGGLSAIFYSVPIGIFSTEHPGYAPGLVWDLLNAARYRELGEADGDDSVAWAVGNLAAVGRHLFGHPQPPWLVRGSLRADDQQLAGLLELLSAPRVALSLEAYLGLAAIACILTELEQEQIAALIEVQRDLFAMGTLSGLAPYIERRWGYASSSPLAGLPVPPEFRPVFRDWAERRVDLVTAEPVPGDDQLERLEDAPPHSFSAKGSS